MSRKSSQEILNWLSYNMGKAKHPIERSHLHNTRKLVKRYRSLLRFLEEVYPEAIEDWNADRSGV